MTRRPLSSLALFALAGLAVPTAMPTPAIAAQTTVESEAPAVYSLYCRGGDPTVHVDSVMDDGLLKFRATVQVKHGGEKYDPGSLEPGRCTWVDRKMNSDEPYHLFFSGSFKNRSLRTSHFAKRLKLGLRDVHGRLSIPEPFEAINKLQISGYVVELRVYAKTLELPATNGNKHKHNVLFVDSVGVIHSIAPPSNKG